MANHDTRIPFIHTHDVLQYLHKLDIKASAELFSDGSGSLHIHESEWEKVNPNIKAKLGEMLHSERWTRDENDYILSSCQGWHP